MINNQMLNGASQRCVSTLRLRRRDTLGRKREATKTRVAFNDARTAGLPDEGLS